MQPAYLELGHIGESVWIVDVVGEHDISTIDYFRDTLVEAPRDGVSLVVDFTRAAFIDSTIVNTILDRARSRDGDGAGETIVVAPTGWEPRRLFDLVDLGRVVRLVESVDDAFCVLAPFRDIDG
jgi:anti-anti-sigma factor